MPQPAAPKIYHIVHMDRLASIITDGALWCDAKVLKSVRPGTTIGITGIKLRRLTNLLNSHSSLQVGDCVPFYFCPRSVMLYVIHMADNRELTYRGGQRPIVHLEADLHDAVEWANRNGRKWAFTLSNAGSTFFEDRCDLAQLDEVDWEAVEASIWKDCREGKQAEFLAERSFPWKLVQRIGVYSMKELEQVREAVQLGDYRPNVTIMKEWYY